MFESAYLAEGGKMNESVFAELDRLRERQRRLEAELADVRVRIEEELAWLVYEGHIMLATDHNGRSVEIRMLGDGVIDAGGQRVWLADEEALRRGMDEETRTWGGG